MNRAERVLWIAVGFMSAAFLTGSLYFILTLIYATTQGR
jgi:phage shock protein PspC (stress-responsive transcriptional regulator)